MQGPGGRGGAGGGSAHLGSASKAGRSPLQPRIKAGRLESSCAEIQERIQKILYGRLQD